jgi:hypothetical protein
MNKGGKIGIAAAVIFATGTLFYLMMKNATNAVKNGADILFSNKMNSFFKAKLIQTAANIGVNANFLSAVIDWETAGTFNPSIQNPISNATGLIQFMPTTAAELGTTINALKNMSGVEQLNYVEKYFKLSYNKNKVKTNFTDFYLIIFYPAANGKPSNYLFPSIVYAQNPAFHTSKGYFTKLDLENTLKKKYPSVY